MERTFGKVNDDQKIEVLINEDDFWGALFFLGFERV